MRTVALVFSVMALLACRDRCLQILVSPPDSIRPTYYRLESALEFETTRTENNADGSTTRFYDANGWRLEGAGATTGDIFYCAQQSEDQHGWRATVWRGTDSNDPCFVDPYALIDTSACEAPPSGAPSGQVVFTFAGEGETVVSIELF